MESNPFWEKIKGLISTKLFDSLGSNEAWAIKIFIAVLITLTFAYLWRKIALKLKARFQKTKNLWDDSLLFALLRPVYFGILLCGAWIILLHLLKLTQIPESAFVISAVMLIGWAVARFIGVTEKTLLKRALENNAQENHEASQTLLNDPTAITAISKLLRLSVIITTTLFALQALSISINAVLAFGGVGGIAIGFAAKDLLANFFGGLFIYLDRPFKVGDWIRSPDREIEGTVEYIGWRQTSIRTFDARPLYLPNAVFNSIAVENPSRMHNRRLYEVIGVRYDDFSKLNDIVEEVRSYLKQHEAIDQKRILMVYFDQFGSSSLNFFIYCFTKTTAWQPYHNIKHKILLDIGNIISSHGAEMAFPTQTLHVHQAPNPTPET